LVVNFAGCDKGECSATVGSESHERMLDRGFRHHPRISVASGVCAASNLSLALMGESHGLLELALMEEVELTLTEVVGAEGADILVGVADRDRHVPRGTRGIHPMSSLSLGACPVLP